MECEREAELKAEWDGGVSDPAGARAAGELVKVVCRRRDSGTS